MKRGRRKEKKEGREEKRECKLGESRRETVSDRVLVN